MVPTLEETLMTRSTLLIGVAVLATGLWHLATIRPGQDWGDDFAMFIAHARNLTEGTDYADTGFIYNPAYTTYAPRTYPPVYPLLLVPVYRLFGLNFEAMKVQQVVFLVLLLLVVYVNIRRQLPEVYAAGVIVLLGLSPFLWLYKDRVMAEIPFMLFACLALHLLDGEPDRPTWRWLGRAFLAGVVVYLACGTRVVGLVLLPAAVLADMLSGNPANGGPRWRLPGLVSFTVLLTFAACLLAQGALLGLEGSYFAQWHYDPARPIRNLVSLARGADEVLGSVEQLPLRLAVLLPLGGLSLVGYVTCLRHRIGARELFIPLYLALLLLWPVGGATPRYLLPLLPVVFIYLGQGTHTLAERVGARWGHLAAVGLAATVLAASVGLYTRVEFGPLRHGVERPEAQALFGYIRENTPADAVIVFSKPRALALFTGRRASPAQTPASDQELWRHLRNINATHFVVGRPFPESDAFLQAFADRNAEQFREVFRNRLFTAYRIVESGPVDGDFTALD
jgi:4-amino-4-deoxy-L-arabinose transferase-like glycosyltransferase